MNRNKLVPWYGTNKPHSYASKKQPPTALDFSFFRTKTLGLQQCSNMIFIKFSTTRVISYIKQKNYLCLVGKKYYEILFISRCFEKMRKMALLPRMRFSKSELNLPWLEIQLTSLCFPGMYQSWWKLDLPRWNCKRNNSANKNLPFEEA